MIIGRDLGELKNYLGLSKNLDYAINYILSDDLANEETGKKELLGKDVTLNIEEYEPRDIEKCLFESHEKYLDIQIVLKGIEGFGYANIKNKDIIITDPYNSEKDITKYTVKPELIYEMIDHSFAIVFPEDLHMPKIKLPNSSNVKKAIFKVRL